MMEYLQNFTSLSYHSEQKTDVFFNGKRNAAIFHGCYHSILDFFKVFFNEKRVLFLL